MKNNRLSNLKVTFILLILSLKALAAAPRNFLYTSDKLENIKDLIQVPEIDGVQVVYNWKSLEIGFNQYDFRIIELDLQFLNTLNKKLFIQIQDRFFDPKHKNVPSYLLMESDYKGGCNSNLYSFVIWKVFVCFFKFCSE